MVGNVDEYATAWNLKAEVGGDCLSARGIVCRACGESCDERAIRFQLEVGGIARPLLDAERCSGCGECFAVCPVKAIRIVALEPLQQAV